MEEDEALEESEVEDLPEEGLLEDPRDRVDVVAGHEQWFALTFQDRAHALIEEYNDVFRHELRMDPPAKVPPLSIELIDESLPERRGGRPRSFAPLQRKFLNEHIQLLLRIGVIEKTSST